MFGNLALTRWLIVDGTRSSESDSTRSRFAIAIASVEASAVTDVLIEGTDEPGLVETSRESEVVDDEQLATAQIVIAANVSVRNGFIKGSLFTTGFAGMGVLH